MSPRKMVKELLRVDAAAWKQEIPKMEKFFAQFGDRLPKRLRQSVRRVKQTIGIKIELGIYVQHIDGG